MVKPRTRKFKQDYAYRLLKIAKDDLYAAKFLLTAPACRPETIGYHTQQCVEKAIKSVLIFLKIEIPMSHDIDSLLERLPDKMIEELPEGAGELTQFATIRRYVDGEELLEKKDLEAAIQVAEFFINWAGSQLPKVI